MRASTPRTDAQRASALPLPLVRRGKVRDVYDAGHGRLLLVATDRVSAFDVVMPDAIPHKGAVLTQITAWWLRQLARAGVVEHHMLSADAAEIVSYVPEVAAALEALRGRAMLCRAAAVYPVECVVRGYLAGSAWKEYQAHGTLAGEPLPPGLRESDRLDPPLFSPATKAERGHDENIPPAIVAAQLGRETAAALERLSRAVYAFGRDHAVACGLVIADTKFEFGRIDDRIVLVDEVLTPDSSRFWPADAIVPGRAPPSFDKQPLRDWLAAERRAGRWNGEAPGPPLPDAVVRSTSERYLAAFARITGAPLDLTAPPSPA